MSKSSHSIESASSVTPDPSYPVLTQTEFDNRAYECVAGKYFTADTGKYVPLQNRPTVTTQEKTLQSVETVLDVVIVGMSTFVYVTSKENMAEIESLLSDAVNESLVGVTDDNSRRESEHLLEFRYS